jgi:glycine/D-amino acid oxidase-like deaminating enzyme
MGRAKTYDTIVIGGGFFGLSIAAYLRSKFGQQQVMVLEKESDFMRRASYNNQARVHGGYHYPRSLLTGLRSQANFSRFVKDYSPAIVTDFDKYYAIARDFSKVSAHQFELFCERIGAYVDKAPLSVREMFDERLVEEVFKVKEYAFNSEILKEITIKQLDKEGVILRTSTSVTSVEAGTNNTLNVSCEDGQTYNAKTVFNCSYSLLNVINRSSNLPILPLKHELAEMCLIELPPELKDISVTMMCGPFFSFMPFPARKLYTLSHVRYTPHSEWFDDNVVRDGHDYLEEINRVTHFPQMISDATRYIPVLHKAVYRDSLWEIKTVLAQSERDDSRPILFRKDHGIHGYHCIMGAKLDNIYDIFRELDMMYEKK